MESGTSQPPQTFPAQDIDVAEFRLLYQWPLFLDARDREIDPSWHRDRLAETRKAVTEKWGEPIDPLGRPDGSGYEAFVYFHDFVQRFLFPRPGDSGVFTLHERTDVKEIEAEFHAGSETPDRHRFTVERHTLHLFDIGIAVLSLELCWTGPGRLTLADVLRITDHLRRSYPAFFSNGHAARVPKKVTLLPEVKESTPPTKTEADAAFGAAKKGTRDPGVMGHWRELLSPLTLISEPGGHWRDPSDERVPLNTYIRIACDDHDDDAQVRAAVSGISEGDWFRIADAEEPGDNAFPYNPRFVREQAPHIFYDRFEPDPGTGNYATRYAFGGQHFSAVGSGKSFADDILQHWRSHYALLSFIARFEMTAMLMTSSRISNTVAVEDRLRRAETDVTGGRWTPFDVLGRSKSRPTSARDYFEREILDTQSQFLRFVHRFRFTGVSSQTQGSEMYALWRKSLRLDALYKDVRDELQSATGLVTSRQQTEEARAATNLSRIAALGVVAALILGGLGGNIFVGGEGWMGKAGWPEWRQLAAVCAATLLPSALAAHLILKTGRDSFSRFLAARLGLLGGLALLVAVLG